MNTVRVGSAVVAGAFLLLVGLLLMYMSSNSELKSQVETLNHQLATAEDTMHDVSTRSAECEKEVLTKQEAGEEMAAILEECKVGRKKFEEDVISWKKRLEELQRSEGATNAKLQELHSKVDDLEADKELLSAKIDSFHDCNKEKEIAVRNHEQCRKELLVCKTASARKPGADLHSQTLRHSAVPGLHSSQSLQTHSHTLKLDPNLHADSTDKELPKVDDEASDDKEDEDIDADTLLDNNEDPLADKDEDPSADGDDYSP